MKKSILVCDGQEDPIHHLVSTFQPTYQVSPICFDNNRKDQDYGLIVVHHQVANKDLLKQIKESFPGVPVLILGDKTGKSPEHPDWYCLSLNEPVSALQTTVNVMMRRKPANPGP